jgi:hypothetical protein
MWRVKLVLCAKISRIKCILVPYMKKAFLYEGVNCHTRTDHNCREQLSSVTREHGWPSLPVDQTLWCSNFDLPKSILFLSFQYTKRGSCEIATCLMKKNTRKQYQFVLTPALQ